MMNNKEILKKVEGILAELNEQFDYLSQSPENLNELELELFSANANFLSDHLAILVKLNDKPKNANESLKSEEPIKAAAIQPSAPKVESPVVAEENKEEVVSDWKFELNKESDQKSELKDKEADKPFDRPLTEKERTEIDDETNVNAHPEEQPEAEETEKAEAEDEEIVEQEEVKEEQKETPALDHSNQNKEEVPNQDSEVEDVHVKEVVISERTIAVPADAVQSEGPAQTLNDLLSKNVNAQTVLSQYNSRPQQDLKGMISLNDKLLFVRDLFNGYSLAYSEAMELLNRFDSFEAADNFLKQNYAPKNNWSEKQDVADKFYEILNRRFTK